VSRAKDLCVDCQRRPAQGKRRDIDPLFKQERCRACYQGWFRTFGKPGRRGAGRRMPGLLDPKLERFNATRKAARAK
jgi:hypothetical protein